jgi:DNA-binding response OmpR family regulator
MANLLLVDDDPDLGLIVTALARQGGHTVACCPDVPTAWKALQRTVPDLLLLDVNLPGISGVELCRRVRVSGGLARLPVALFTHWGLPGDVAAGLEAGADFVLAKDLIVRPPDWQRRLEEILARAHGQPPGPSLGWEADAGAGPLGDWVGPLNKVLGHASLRRLGAEVLHVVLRRALEQTSNGNRLPATDLLSWLKDGTRLDPGLVGSVPARLACAFLAQLADQLWCLLGTEGSAALRLALAEILPGRPKDEG